MPGKKKRDASALGKQLLKVHGIKKSGHQNKHVQERHTVDLNEGDDWARLNLRSVTEESSLQEFLSTAEMANKEFCAERENVKLVNVKTANIDFQSKEKTFEQFEDEHKPFLCIPRRPDWSEEMTAEELTELEYQSFLNWRRDLAKLEEKENAILTPFERNLEFWRQLWRVLERSDVIVQIVDARNPLLFYSEDLCKYVEELDDSKRNLILVNKADYLNQQQRETWLKYFHDHNQHVIFFSALEEENKLKAINEEEEEENNDDDDDEIEEKEINDEIKDDVDRDDDEIDDNEKNCNQDKLTENASRLNRLSLSEESEMYMSRIFSKDELIKYFKTLNNKDKTLQENKQITIGFVGYPNVGKSSTINALLQTKKVSVSATPGKTKHFQTLYIDDELCLCDCPGLVFPKLVSSKAEMIVNGILPIDQMTNYLDPVNLIVSFIPRHIFEEIYSIVLPNDPRYKLTGEMLLTTYGRLRGYMTQRGLPDIARIARFIIKDFVSGRLLYCYAPPGIEQEKFFTFRDETEAERTREHRIAGFQKHLLPPDLFENEFNMNYFKKQESNVHCKGVRGVSDYTRYLAGKDRLKAIPSTMNSNLNDANINVFTLNPSKKHYNRKKKEKLRRVYQHLDVN